MRRFIMWIIIACVFVTITISTMLDIVLALHLGLSKLPFGILEKYSQAMAGLIIFLCGSAIKFLGL